MKAAFSLLAACLTTTVSLAQSPKPTMALLQGKWQSTTDKTNFLVFEQNKRKEMAGGSKEWSSEPFVLASTCQNDANKDQQTPEENRYISVPGDGLCWYVVSVNATQLTLSYMGRGNTLSYRRVVEAKKPAPRKTR